MLEAHSGLYAAEPDVLKADAVPALKWGPPDEQGLVDFLVGEKNFNEDRVRKQVQKMAATKGKSNQGGLLCRTLPPAPVSPTTACCYEPACQFCCSHVYPCACCLPAWLQHLHPGCTRSSKNDGTVAKTRADQSQGTILYIRAISGSLPAPKSTFTWHTGSSVRRTCRLQRAEHVQECMTQMK